MSNILNKSSKYLYAVVSEDGSTNLLSDNRKLAREDKNILEGDCPGRTFKIVRYTVDKIIR